MSQVVRKWRIILAAVLLLATTNELKASHAMGADLTYQCLSGNTYRVRLSFYRDCIGVNAPNNVSINVRSASCNRNLSVTCNRVPGTGQEVNYLCPTAISTCNGGTFTGIQEYVYEGVITLPMQCADWVFSYSLCCRNAAISTITTPGSSTFYIYATLNNLVAQCNSSPQFSNKPVPFACLGQELCFNHGAFDADGDSLVYTLVNPKQTVNSNVNYINPYSATNPIASTPAMQFNNQTGDICFTPTQQQVTVMAVLVSEYRNGQLIGTVVRDIQVTVLNCNNDLPSLSGINGTNNFNLTVCEGQPTCFNIFSSDLNGTQQLSLVYNQAIPGASFTSSTGLNPTGTFCWTPSKSDVSNTPHCFTVQVKDDACPFNGSQTFSYCITVKGITVNAGPDQNIACTDLATITAQASGGTPPYTYLWSNGSTSPAQTVPVGTYIVTVSDGTCSGTDTVNVISSFEPVAAFSAASGCAGTAVSFNDLSTTPGTMTSWSWNFGDGTSSTQQNPSHTYSSPGTYQVLLQVTNIYGCVDSVIQPVLIRPVPVVSFTNGTACEGSAVTFTNTSTPAGGSWNWSFSNGTTSTQQNPSVIFTPAGTYSATLTVTDTNGCSATLTQQVVVSPLPVANFSNSTPLCIGSPIQFTDLSTGNPVSWNWTFGDNTSSTSQNPSHTYTIGGTIPVTLVVTNAAGCTATFTKSIVINTPPSATAGPDRTVCLGSSITLTANGATTYVWQPGNLSGSSITVSPSVNSTYTVVATDANGCTNRDTIAVTVLPLPVASTGPDQVICLGQSATLTSSGGVSYSWSPSGATTQNITVSPSNSGTYAVNVTGTNGCTATAFVNVTVRPLPVINLPVAVFFCTGVSTVLDPGPGTSYIWSTGATTQTISVNTAGTYSVTVTNQFGCTNTGNTQVTVGGQTINNNPAAVLCQGQSAVLNAGPGVSYQWNTGATSQSITVNSAGTYQVTVLDANGCTGVISNTVAVNPMPSVNFTPIDVCINTPVVFTDLSSVNGGTIASWNWDLGDGNVSFQQNPVHNYSSSGSFLVTLTVTTSAGCSASFTDTVNVYPEPNANFSYNFACSGTPIPFIDQSNTQFGNIISWLWDFQDGTTSTLQNPQHAFAQAGTYNVTLTVSTAGGCSDTRPRVIHIYPGPNVSFAPNLSSVCLGEAISITNTSSTSNGGINDWSWVFGDGATSAAANPVHTYTTPGTYNIQLTATTSHGCIDTMSQTVTINPLPAVNAGADQVICRGSSATLSATGGGTYLWQPGGATTASIIVSPLNTTTYTVTVTSAQGCTSSDSVRVSVNSVPVANAGANQSVCTGNSVTLIATGGSTYSWSPGGATTAGITVTPSTTTSYIVTVAGTNGCTSRDTVIVTVNPLPVANAGPDQVLCLGETATITATGGVSYLWSPTGSTSQSIYVAPTVPSQYSVIVTDANGCSSRDTMAVTINPTPQVTLGSAFFCAGSSITLDAGNPGMTYEWAPGGETTQSIIVNTPGWYSVVVTNAFGCNGSGSVNVVEGGTGLGSSPIAIHGCLGETVSLDAGNPGMTYSWSTGATSQVIQVSNAGLYTVTVTDSTGCVATFTDSVTLHPLPVTAFSATDVCLQTVTQFQDQTTVSSGNIMTWEWNFSNGYSSNVQNPTFLFTQPGTYNVQLIATTGMGCRDSIQQTVDVYPTPVASFTSVGGCENGASQFINTSTVNPGNITTALWSFGDGTNSSTLNTTHTYMNPGVYTVTLIAGSSFGCKDTTFGSVTVNAMPQPSFVALPVCEGDTSFFINTSNVQNATLSDFTWDFGDGTGSSLRDPAHKYSAAGNYLVTLIAGSDAGCIDTVQQLVVVYPNPVAAASVAPVCEGSAATFVNLSNANGGGPILYNFWNFGNGVYSGMQQPVYTYAGNGTFNGSLIVTSIYGCMDTVTFAATVNAAPQAQFTSVPSCLGSTTQFNATTVPNASSYQWNFGDFTIGTGVSPSHTYAATGGFNVSMIVTSAQGCRDTAMQTVNVYPIPVANFFSASVCLQNQTVFTDLSTVSGGSTFQYAWNFGDGNTGNTAQATNMYQQAGIYNVQLTVVSAEGCSASVMKPVEVYNLPNAIFNANDNCLNLPTFFNDGSSVAQGSISFWNWTLGDGTNSNMQNPIHTYAASGSFPVTLQVTSNHGCRSNANDSVTIFRPPTPSPTSQEGCVGANMLFTDNSPSVDPNIIQTWEWDFGNGMTSTQSAPVIAFTTPGPQTVTLTTTNVQGCKSTASVTVMMNPLPVAGFTNSNACNGTAVQFNNTSTIGGGGTITGYNWNFGDGTPSSSAVNPSHIFPQAGTYNVLLIVTSNEGCADTTTASVTVHPLPVSHFHNIPVSGCGPLHVAFTDSSYISSGTISTWFWNFGDGGSATTQNPVHTFAQSGSFAVSLTVTSNNGCSATSTQPNAVIVYPGPLAAFTPSPYTQNITNPVFDFNNLSSGGIAYNWTFGDGTGSLVYEPNHVYADTGSYTVTLWVTNSYGCRDSATQVIHVEPIFTFFIPNAFTPNDDGVNDGFNVKGISIVDVKLSIFNRWGDHIFFSEGQNNMPWDGSIMGKSDKAKQDVYVYQIFVKDVWGVTHERVGHVSLVR